MVVRVDDIAAARRLRALSHVQEGRLYDLGHELHEGIPVFPGRYYRQTLVPNPGPRLGSNMVDWTTEVITATTQVGTHLDALCHLREGDVGHDGWNLLDDSSPAGATRLGIETAPQFVTTGWLVDAGTLGPGEVVGLDALEGIDPMPGDAVLFHTGWGANWIAPEVYLEGEPGPGLEVARWLVERGVALTGCDTWSYGPVPAEDPDRPFEVPQLLNVHHGVYVVENLDLRRLAADGVRTFALILTHPRLRGATGAWTSPIALV
ncbi:MAG: cyclase family protein [Solirubrobacterales bacterium]|nr:cyclase family protein [Solirubrobacterales bacterium]